jgi:hypothetical protein
VAFVANHCLLDYVLGQGVSRRSTRWVQARLFFRLE